MNWLVIVFHIVTTHDGEMSSWRGWVADWAPTASECYEKMDDIPLKDGEQITCRPDDRHGVTVLQKRVPGEESSRELYPHPRATFRKPSP